MDSILDTLTILERTPNVNHSMMNGYLVQAEPQRRLMFLDPYGEDWRPTTIDLPLPYVLYYVELPARGMGGAGVGSMFCRPEPAESSDDELYALPLPNMYGRWCEVSHCGNIARLQEGFTEEQNVAWVINAVWETSWRYIMLPEYWAGEGRYGMPEEYMPPRNGAYKWLGVPAAAISGRVRSYGVTLPKLYGMWEKLSVEEATAMPWGRPRAGTIQEFIEWRTNDKNRR